MPLTSSLPGSNRSGFSFLLLCFFGSGATGLVYQILWVRLIERVVGAAPFAIAIVLAVFMAGLGLGSYLASRWIDRQAEKPARLVKLYGVLELGIGASALLVPLLLLIMRPLYAWLYQSVGSHLLIFGLLTGGLAALVLIVPTTLMGATLPLLCRYAVDQLDSVGRRTGLLYGLNTIGAALGALLTGMLLLPELGVTRTLLAAVALNGVIGLSCIWYAGRAKPAVARMVSRQSRKQKPQSATSPVELPPPTRVGYLLTLVAVSGFCSLAYEVLLTRLLSLVVGPTTYSFTVVLVTFIAGLGFGSLIFGWLGDRVSRPDLLLLWSQLGAGLTMLVASQLLGDSQFFFGKLLFTYQGSFERQQLMKALALFAFMIVPTLCLGGTFPLISRVLARSTETLGQVLGFSYAINTVGCVAGSVVAGFVLIPLAGKEHGLSLIVGLQLTAVGVGAFLLGGNRKRQLASLAGLAGLGLAATLVMPRWNHLHLSSSKYQRFQRLIPAFVQHGWLASLLEGDRILSTIDEGELLYYGEGIGGFTTVVRTSDALGNPEIAMANSGKFDASSVGDMKTQVLLAHVPLLAHPNPEQVMILGLGSGITGGEALLYPSVKRLDIVEIGPQVVGASHYFDQFNGRVLEDPRTRLIIQDARAHLALSGQTYDVVISEPSNPWMAGMASLFTGEFFSLVKEHLRPGGIYVQFIHNYEIDWESFSLVMRTFATVFPNGVMLATHPSHQGLDYLLVGFADSTARLNFTVGAEQRAALQRSQNLRLSDPGLLDRLVVTEDLKTLGGTGPVNTEDSPLLEFTAPRSLYAEDNSIPDRIRQLSRLSPATTGRLQSLQTPESQLAYADFALSLRTPFAGMEPVNPDADQRTRFAAMIQEYTQKYQTRCTLFQERQAATECVRNQTAMLEPRAGSLGSNEMAYLGDLYLLSGRRLEARMGLERALAQDSTSLLALNDLGMLSGQEGNHLEAIDYFERAQRLNPFLPEPYLNLGIAYLSLGRKEWAARNFKTALEIDPASPIARQGLQRSMTP